MTPQIAHTPLPNPTQGLTYSLFYALICDLSVITYAYVLNILEFSHFRKVSLEKPTQEICCENICKGPLNKHHILQRM
jgi:hypothetical protein